MPACAPPPGRGEAMTAGGGKGAAWSTHASLPACGIGGIFQQITLSQAGSTWSNMDFYNVFRVMKHKSTVSQDYVFGAGNAMSGTNDIKDGEEIDAGNSRVFVDPIEHHTSMFQCGKMIPMFSKDALDLRFTLDTAKCLRWSQSLGANVPLASDVTVSEVELLEDKLTKRPFLPRPVCLWWSSLEDHSRPPCGQPDHAEVILHGRVGLLGAIAVAPVLGLPNPRLRVVVVGGPVLLDTAATLDAVVADVLYELPPDAPGHARLELEALDELVDHLRLDDIVELFRAVLFAPAQGQVDVEGGTIRENVS